MNQQELLDFHTSIGEEISIYLEAVVDPEFLSPHEAIQPFYQIYGTGLAPSDIYRLSLDQLSRITTEYNDYFEVTTLTKELVIDFLRAALLQWDDIVFQLDGKIE